MAVRFSVNRGSVDRAMEELHVTTGKLCLLSEEIRACNNSLHISSGNDSSIKASLKSVIQQVLYEASVAEQLQHAAEYAVLCYTSCEQKVLGQLEEAEKAAERSCDRGTDKRGVLEQMGDQLLGEDKTTAYTATTEEQRAAEDMELQLRIAHVMDTEYFSKNTWKNASMEERKNILQDCMNDVSQILGIHVKKEVEFFNAEPVNGLLTNGYYDPGQNRIYMNEYVINMYPPEDSYYLMTTIIHELRHAYQSQAMKKPTEFKVDQETIDQWEDNVRNYQDSLTEGFQKYRDQPVETDARVFAGQEGKGE